jgi:hypothetical protein
MHTRVMPLAGCCEMWLYATALSDNDELCEYCASFSRWFTGCVCRLGGDMLGTGCALEEAFKLLRG